MSKYTYYVNKKGIYDQLQNSTYNGRFMYTNINDSITLKTNLCSYKMYDKRIIMNDYW